MTNLYAYPDVERRGLCNMLFPWARAVLFARDHNCKVIAPSWVKINRIGPILRQERDKRFYVGQFTNDGYIKGMTKWWLLATRKCISEEAGDLPDSGVIVFTELRNYFSDLCGESLFLKNELLRITSAEILKSLGNLPQEFVGVHIRKGDFARMGWLRPANYYIRAIERAKELVGKTLPVLVFSDAKERELDYLNGLSMLRFMPSASALHDMLALSKSSVMVGTNNSTFSEWAAFLGGMKSLWDANGDSPKGLHNIELL